MAADRPGGVPTEGGTGRRPPGARHRWLRGGRRVRPAGRSWMDRVAGLAAEVDRLPPREGRQAVEPGRPEAQDDGRVEDPRPPTCAGRRPARVRGRASAIRDHHAARRFRDPVAVARDQDRPGPSADDRRQRPCWADWDGHAWPDPGSDHRSREAARRPAGRPGRVRARAVRVGPWPDRRGRGRTRRASDLRTHARAWVVAPGRLAGAVGQASFVTARRQR
jgi:hypothetical protein